MRLEEFGGCCGVNIIEGFPYYRKLTDGEKKTFLNLIDEHMREGAGMLLATLNKTQRPHIDQFLRDNGFKPGRPFKNPRHPGSTLVLYQKRTPNARIEDDDDDLIRW